MKGQIEKSTVELFAEELYEKFEMKGDGEVYQSLLDKFKKMEKEKHEKFNKFLNDEKQLGISDLKTIERIQWYYNTYFNENYGGNKE